MPVIRGAALMKRVFERLELEAEVVTALSVDHAATGAEKIIVLR